MPTVFNVPTLSILAATLLDFGTEEQKKRHIPAILRGDELWVQFLSEPSGGSDLAGLVTRATRDGDVFILNGSKIWSTGAHKCDYAMCLARTNWQVPKHRGLTMFIMKIHQPGVEIQQIKMLNGSVEFCQEFFDDVVIPASDVVGEVDDGWTVASRLLYHERDAVGGGSPYISGMAVAGFRPRHAAHRPRRPGPAQRPGLRLPDPPAGGRGPGARPGPGPARPADHHRHPHRRPAAAGRIASPGSSPPPPPSATSTSPSTSPAPASAPGSARKAAGDEGRAGSSGPPTGATPTSIRQGGSLGGGSTEMQRNIISERVLGMPREYAADRELPFDQVRHN